MASQCELFEMFPIGSFPINESFQRLEDFPSYTSCIKCFGKPIIPSVLTAHQREELCGFRAAAVKREAENLERKNEQLVLLKKVKEVYYKVGEHLAACNKDDFFSNCEPGQHEISALHSSSATDFQTSLSKDTTFLSNEMHVSMCKIPSSGICSTVHRGVIVCSNVIDGNKGYDEMSKVEIKCTRNTNQKEYCQAINNPECNLCQLDCRQDLFVETATPYESFPNEQICSVSEDEQGSVNEETELSSLPTVICAQRFNSQDTDNESNATFYTQSTDLEKYLDCSIEFSSPDDMFVGTKCEINSQLNISTRSDDASSETLVNTESELTPCASSMAVFNDFTNDVQSEANDVESNFLQSAETSSSYIPQRAYSVDSYMKILKTCARNLLIKKSHSEPSHSEATQLSGLYNSLCESNSFNLMMENVKEDSESKPEDEFDRSQELKDEANTFISDSKIPRSKSECLELKPGENKLFRKKHIRRNSYTLDHPSSALLMAHAECTCSEDFGISVPPHSCSTDKKSPSPPNPAFKKEKINIVLPPTPDRDKYFPVLSSSSISIKSTDSNKSIFSEVLTLETDVREKELNSETNSCPGSVLLSGAANEVNTETVEASHASSTLEITHQNEQINVKSSIEPSDLKGNEVHNFLKQVVCDLQEMQKNRVQELLDEQNKQWLRLQNEFKEQERLLCERLNLVDISSNTDGVVPSVPHQLWNEGINNCDGIEQSLPKLDIHPVLSSFSNLSTSTRAEDRCLTSTTIGNDGSSEVNLSEESSERTSVPSCTSSKSISDAGALLNVMSEFSHSSIDGLKSTSSFNSVANVNEVCTSVQPSTASTDDSLQANTTTDFEERSDSIQSSVSLKSSTNAHEQSKTYNAHILKERSNSNQSGFFVKSSSSTEDNFKIAPEISHVLLDNCQAGTSLKLAANVSHVFSKDSHNSAESGIFPKSPTNTDSISEVGLPEVLPNSLDRNCSSSFKSSSDLSQSSDGPVIVFCNLQPILANVDSGNNTSINSASLANAYNYGHEQGSSDSNYSDCHTCLDCYYVRSSEKCHHLSDRHGKDSENLFDSPISSANLSEGSPISAFKKNVAYQAENFTPMGSDLSLLSKHGREMSFKNIGCKTVDVNSVESPNYYLSEKHHSLKDNNSRQNMVLATSEFVLNTKNSFTQMNSLNKGDDCAREDELKAMMDFVRCSTSSSSSHSCQSVEMCPIPLTNNSTKKRSDSQSLQNSHELAVSIPLSSQTGAPKQMISASLTNLKRRQSRDIMKEPGMLKKFEKLPAFVKGYLTRRLFKTERVQDLLKTLKDTVVMLGKLKDELTVKGDSVTERDVDFHRQLIVQLMTTFHTVYNIFCESTTEDQMKIISESRNLQLKKRASENSIASVPSKKPKLSAATLKALERKRRPTIDSRTYTVEDFKGCRPRVRSVTSTRSTSTSPSRIYKSSVGLPMKRKTASVRNTHPWK